ncbi:Uncharacterized protein GBIM_13305 [Gryllus bimaculatus]|nr:Uncharacterized protein GBIM_13305 [Gryllus bimaculatus]
MPSRRNKFKTSWIIGPSKNEPINDRCSVGRKLLEKMGWENGLGLGKDNQGMTENPLWKYNRGDSKTGFKCKDEMANEILPHQNAFEDLLGELNSQTGEESINTDDSLQRKSRERVKTCKKHIRYKKMARAKDISNYSAKDFEGIVGKKITKKNLDLLRETSNCGTLSNIKVTNEVFASLECESSSEQFDMDNKSFNLLKRNKQLCVSQKHEKTCVESSTIVSEVSYVNEELEESGNPKKKNKRHSFSSFTLEPNACSMQAFANTSTESINDQCKESEATEDVDVFNSERSFKKKSRKIDGNSENCAIVNTNDSTLQSSEISKKKKKKKMKENMGDSNTPCTEYNSALSDTNLDEKPTSREEFMCNTKSISEIRQKQTLQNKSVSRNAVTEFDSSVITSEKSSNFEKTETKKEGSKVSNGCTTSNDASKNDDNNSLIFLRQNNNFFLTGEERKKIKKHLAENPAIIQQVASAFVGSNLMSIKGYGNW